MSGDRLAAALLACPRMREAVARDTARNRARLAGGPSPPAGRVRLAALAGLALALILLGAILAGCAVSLYSHEWDARPSQADCDARYTETEARAVPACASYEWRERE